MDALNEFDWSDLIDYGSLLDDVEPRSQNVCLAMEGLFTGTPSFESECADRKISRKRTRNDLCGDMRSKACRERLRREKLNERFFELSAILEPVRNVKTEKVTLLCDAIKLLNRLKTETKEYKESNERLSEEIKHLKAEKNELRKEKHILKMDKEMMEQKLKTMSTSGIIPFLPSLYQGSMNNPVIPNYGILPVWHCLPSATRDTSRDHELRSPAA